MTKFKVGDRVRLTGEQWKREEMHDEIVEIVGIDRGDGDAKFKYGGDTWWVYSRDDDFSATLVEPAPPPADTRKRLREYTDLADGDAVVIAGVELKIVDGMNREPTVACTGSRVPLDHPILGDMFVDEVRRKPRTKKRRVYEEVVDPTEVRVGDIHCFDGAENFVRRDEDLKVMSCAITRTVYRLIEETEVQR